MVASLGVRPEVLSHDVFALGVSESRADEAAEPWVVVAGTLRHAPWSSRGQD